jgi:hypothetical protein
MSLSTLICWELVRDLWRRLLDLSLKSRAIKGAVMTTGVVL